jgi:hypothetical protein
VDLLSSPDHHPLSLTQKDPAAILQGPPAIIQVLDLWEVGQLIRQRAGRRGVTMSTCVLNLAMESTFHPFDPIFVFGCHSNQCHGNDGKES